MPLQLDLWQVGFEFNISLNLIRFMNHKRSRLIVANIIAL